MKDPYEIRAPKKRPTLGIPSHIDQALRSYIADQLRLVSRSTGFGVDGKYHEYITYGIGDDVTIELDLDEEGKVRSYDVVTFEISAPE